MILSSITLIASYLFAAACLVAFLLAITPELRKRPIETWIAAIGLGPLLLSACVYSLLTFLPGRANGFYVATTLLVLAGLGLSGWKQLRSAISSFAALSFDLTAALLRWEIRTLFVWLMYAAIVLLFLSAALNPVVANDPLEYLQAARVVFTSKSAALYPPIDTAQTGGLYGPWSHPPAYVFSLTWGYLLQGTADHAGVAKLIAPYFAAANALLLLYVGGGPRKTAGLIAAILLITTPYFFSSASQASIDSMRIFPFTLGIVALHLLSQYSWRVLIPVALAIAGALYTHSLGVLLIPMFLAVAMVYGRESIQSRITYAGLAVLIAMLLASPFYLKNLQLFGALVSDMPPLWAVPELQYDEYFRVSRDIDSPYERMMFGILQGLSKYPLFGLTYYLLIACSLHFLAVSGLKAINRPRTFSSSDLLPSQGSLLMLAVLMLATFYGGVVLSVFLGMDTMIKNARYMLTMQPVVALIPALYFARYLDEADNDQA